MEKSQSQFLFLQAGGGFLAYKRFQAGADAAFSQGLADDEGFGTATADAAGYQAGYAGEDAGYGEQPFSGGGQSAGEKREMKPILGARRAWKLEVTRASLLSLVYYTHTQELKDSRGKGRTFVKVTEFG